MTSQELSIDEAVDLALRHHQAGNLSEAEEIYRQVLQADPGHADALHYLGVIALQTGDPEAAVDRIRQAIDLAPRMAPYYSNLGEAQRALGRLEEAAESYRRALEIDPGFAMAHNNLANVLADAGRFEEALTSYEQASLLMPDDPEVRLNRANLLVELGRVRQAIPEYRQLLDAFPHYAAAWNAFGLALESEKNLNEALRAFQSAVENAPNDQEARVNLERARWDRLQSLLARADRDRAQEDWSAAATAYEQVIEQDPDRAEAHFGLGVCRNHQGQPEEAIAALERAVRIQPFFEDAHAALGEILIAREDGSTGVESVDGKRRPALWTALAIAHYRAERFAQAEHTAEQAVRGLGEALARNREDNESWTLLGLALRAIRDVAKSEDMLRRQLRALGL